jgi:hypothetical protein
MGAKVENMLHIREHLETQGCNNSLQCVKTTFAPVLGENKRGCLLLGSLFMSNSFTLSIDKGL